MAAIRTARERAREELTREIKAEARRQLAAEGAQRLSLRAVARELEMASSALYRYFPSRDELLTALIVDAYNALAEHEEQALAAAPPDDARERWRVLSAAVRAWARTNPHEYALLYGTPVPGYAAPATTVGPATRVIMPLLSVLRVAAAGEVEPRSGATPVSAVPARPLSDELSAQMRTVTEQFAPEVRPDRLAGGFTAWTQLFGMISFELFGHLVGSVDPADAFFARSVEEMADLMGLAQSAPVPAS